MMRWVVHGVDPLSYFKGCTLKAATRSHLVSDDTPTSRVANTKLLENEFWGTVHPRYIFNILNPSARIS